MKQYNDLKKIIAAGWNTWNTRSVLSHVLLPQGFAINLGFKEQKNSLVLRESLIGRFGENDEIIHPAGHAYNGSYTSLNLKWAEMEFEIESAAQGDDLVLLIKPIKLQISPPLLIIELGMLWNRAGHIHKADGFMRAVFDDNHVDVYNTGNVVVEANIPCLSPYTCVTLDKPIGISTGEVRSIEEIQHIISCNKSEYENEREIYGELSEDYYAMQSCLAWDTIYEPSGDRVISPVSRLWSVDNCGYIMFCWDTYFAAYMAFDNRELAYSNAIEMTRSITDKGFVPNFAATNNVSLDRSQPPVGSMVIKELYRRYREKWLLEEVFNNLFIWNTWFYKNRLLEKGLMAWGSNPREVITGNRWNSAGVNDTFGGALESGLDNSPMYDDILFDHDRHMMNLADVGLMGLFIMDCTALADIADILGKTREAAIINQRKEEINSGMLSLWDMDFGMFLNRNTIEDSFSYRISPTNFYSLFASGISKKQIDDMMDNHFYNPEEFWGEYIMPSIARNDPAYQDQNYWRGRIWAPMNFLTYLAMRNSGVEKARCDLVKKSHELLMKEWLENGHVHENYNGTTGEGCDVENSDKFYHWGALLALMSLIEGGHINGLEEKL